jgi:hypothetical protein
LSKHHPDKELSPMVTPYLVLALLVLLSSCKEAAKNPEFSAQVPFQQEQNLRQINSIQDSISWVPFNINYLNSDKPYAEKNQNSYTYSDITHGGASQIKTQTQNNGVHCHNYDLKKSNYEYYPYVGWGQNLNENLSRHKEGIRWISYSYKGVTHSFQPRINSIKDYGHFRTFLPETSQWTQALIKIDELTQPSFAQKVKWNPALLYAIDWIVQGSDGEIGEICIGNIKLGYSQSTKN